MKKGRTTPQNVTSEYIFVRNSIEDHQPQINIETNKLFSINNMLWLHYTLLKYYKFLLN